MSDVLRTVAARLDVSVEQAAARAGIPLVVGSSRKAALDIDWDDPTQTQQALARLLEQVQALNAFLRRELSDAWATPPLREQWATVQQILTQDLEPDPDGAGPAFVRA